MDITEPEQSKAEDGNGVARASGAALADKPEAQTDAAKPDAQAAAAADGRVFLDFDESRIKGDGFTQLNPKTGWFWVGINLNKFSFRDAWAFIKSQEYLISSYLTQRENAAMIRAQLANKGPKAGPGIEGLARKLGLPS